MKRLIGFFIAGVFFILFTFFPVRIDLSKGRAYTLAPSTKKIVSSLSKNARITFYVSSDIPTRLIPLRNEITQLFQEYRRASKRLAIETKDPKNDSEATKKAEEMGIPKLQYSQLEQNKYQTSSFYFGVVIEYDGKTEIIPQVSDYANLEYTITSALYRLTKKEIPSIGVIGDPQTFSQQSRLGVLKQTLAQQYSVRDISFDNNDEENKDPLNNLSTLVVVDDGITTLSSDIITKIKKFYEAGKHVVVLAGGVWIDEQSLQASEAMSNINELTATYGAQINSDLVLSTSAEYVNFGNATMQFLTPYPFWIRTNIFNQESPLFINTQYVTFPWTSSISLTKQGSIKITPIVSSSKTSWSQTKEFILDPNSLPQPLANDLKERILGVELKNTKGGVMIVVPSSRFAMNQYLSQGSGNLDFILNAIDQISSNGALGGIRSRTASFYPIPDMTDAMKNVYKYTALAGGTIVWTFYLIFRFIKKRKLLEN